MVEEEPSAELESEEAIDNTGRGNQSQPVQWLTHDDPILQIKIDYPSNWDKRECPDSVMFGPDYFRIDLEVETESLFPSTDTPQKYMREVLNENREYQMDIIGLNETTVNDYPAYRAQYKIGDSITLSYFIVDKNDYTGYHIEYDAEEKYFSKYLPDIERMVNSFQITK
jgi:hypothetical protein